jgi:hypothetical protein
MILLSLGLLISFFVQSFFVIPLFFILHLYLINKNTALLTAIIVGFVIDMFWVYPLGQTGLFLLVFILLFELYSKKYNPYNQLLLFIYLALSSIVYYKFTALTTHFLSIIPIFIVSYIVLFQTAGNKAKQRAETLG